MTPVLVVHGERGETVLCETRAITEWAEETTFDPPLMSADAGERAETRRLVQWFERKFDYEVNACCSTKRWKSACSAWARRTPTRSAPGVRP
jgi:glutathione S-transferase